MEERMVAVVGMVVKVQGAIHKDHMDMEMGSMVVHQVEDMEADMVVGKVVGRVVGKEVGRVADMVVHMEEDMGVSREVEGREVSREEEGRVVSREASMGASREVGGMVEETGMVGGSIVSSVSGSLPHPVSINILL